VTSSQHCRGQRTHDRDAGVGENVGRGAVGGVSNENWSAPRRHWGNSTPVQSRMRSRKVFGFASVV
jgi:hypothetical protein